MFCATAAFDHASAFQIEQMLDGSHWTDLVHIAVDGAIAYRDDRGVANDLVPALDVVLGTLHGTRTPIEVALGRRSGPWQMVTRIVSTPLEVMWSWSARDLRLDRVDGESPEVHRARLRTWLEGGHLSEARLVLTALFDADLERAAAAGLVRRPGTLDGPFLRLRGLDPDDPMLALHTSYAGSPPPLGTDRVLLDLLCGDLGDPDIEVRVDHLGEVRSLRGFRELLASLASPVPPVPHADDGEAA